jgi:hypothetical protein
MFGGPTGVFRLLQSGLGDQAGWLLGFSLVAALALLAVTRLRRSDPRTGWLIVVGGALLVIAVVFSFASGIFHPYYVSLMAPFAAAFVGAGTGLMLERGTMARIVAPLAIAAGAVTELVVLGETGGQLSWAVPVVVAVGGVCAVALGFRLAPRLRGALVAAALAALLAAPAVWAAETLGHATNGTFPTGGPASASVGGPGGFGGPGGPGGPGPGGPRPGGSGRPGGASTGGFGPSPAAGFAGPPAGAGARGPGAGGFGAGGGGGFGGDSSTITAAVRYARAHGGGTIGVASQGSAASAILSSNANANANVAGLGGFSGRESSVSPTWIASEVRAGRLRWVIVDSTQGVRLPGDTRTGSQAALSAVERACRAVTVPSGATSDTMYDCLGRADAIAPNRGSG